MAQRISMLGLMLIGASFTAQAQALSDPTRPPTAVAPAQAGAEGERGGPRLQSVLIAGSRKLAVIDGVTVPLGGKVGGATVVSIAETEVKLRLGEEVQTLKLYPGIERQPVDMKESRP